MPTLPARLRYLRNAEAFCSVALPVLLCFNWQQSATPVAWAMRLPALALVSFLLLQGVLYWHLKLDSVVRRQPLPAYFQPLYRVLKQANLPLVVAVAGFVAVTSAAATKADLAWACGLLAFAVLEHVNYYHYQLMYDTRAAFASLRRNGRLRKAALGLDLQRRAAA